MKTRTPAPFANSCCDRSNDTAHLACRYQLTVVAAHVVTRAANCAGIYRARAPSYVAPESGVRHGLRPRDHRPSVVAVNVQQVAHLDRPGWTQRRAQQRTAHAGPGRLRTYCPSGAEPPEGRGSVPGNWWGTGYAGASAGAGRAPARAPDASRRAVVCRSAADSGGTSGNIWPSTITFQAAPTTRSTAAIHTVL